MTFLISLLSPKTGASRKQRLAHVIGVRQVQNSVADQHHQFFMFTIKRSRQGTVVRFHDDAFPDPLPELFLRGPEFLAVAANHQRRFLFLCFLLLLFFRHALNLFRTRGPRVVVPQ